MIREDHLGLTVGGQINVRYFSDTQRFTRGVDDEEHVEDMLNAFL